jgi:hypothetical protein
MAEHYECGWPSGNQRHAGGSATTTVQHAIRQVPDRAK